MMMHYELYSLFGGGGSSTGQTSSKMASLSPSYYIVQLRSTVEKSVHDIARGFHDPCIEDKPKHTSFEPWVFRLNRGSCQTGCLEHAGEDGFGYAQDLRPCIVIFVCPGDKQISKNSFKHHTAARFSVGKSEGRNRGAYGVKVNTKVLQSMQICGLWLPSDSRPLLVLAAMPPHRVAENTIHYCPCCQG